MAVNAEQPSRRAAALASSLQQAAEALADLVETIDDDRWRLVPQPGVWSIGKDAAHVAEATVMHQWIVRTSVGEKVPSRRPPVEREEMTTEYSPMEMAELIRNRAREGASLIHGLTDPQLDQPTRPPRARGQLLGETVERLLIGHIRGHHVEILTKLRGKPDSATGSR